MFTKATVAEAPKKTRNMVQRPIAKSIIPPELEDRRPNRKSTH